MKQAEAEPDPLADRRRHLGQFVGERPAARPVHVRGEPLAEVGRDQRHQHADDQDQPGDAGGDDRQLDRGLARQDAGAQQDAEDDQRQRVEDVLQGEEGDHPPRHLVAAHPGFAQSPVGEGDATRSARREDPRRRQARQVDVVGLAPVEAQDVAPDDGFEHGDVGGDRGQLKADRDGDPERVGVAELAERVAEADQLREEEVDPDQQRNDDQDGLDHPPWREQR